MLSYSHHCVARAEADDGGGSSICGLSSDRDFSCLLKKLCLPLFRSHSFVDSACTALRPILRSYSPVCD